MTTPRYPDGCLEGSQVHGDKGVPGAFWQVGSYYGFVYVDYRNHEAFVRPCRVVARPGECKGEVSLKAVYDAWRCARRNKRPSANQLAFEVRWMDKLLDLQKQLSACTWKPLPTTSFIASRPKARQIHAPDFSDRVVHHLVVPTLEAIYEPVFIHDSYANRVGKGTHAAVNRLKQFVRQVADGQGGGWYLQLDIANFFYSINRRILWAMLKDRLSRDGVSDTVMHVVHALLARHVEQYGVIHRETAEERKLVPRHKRLENTAPDCGLPIGNLPSQFFANVYMNELDQFIKHDLKAKRYLRYVDDFILVHQDRSVLDDWQRRIVQFLADRLQLRLKDDVRLRPLSAGIDFLGYIIYPTHTRVRRRVLTHATEALRAWHDEHVHNGELTATPADYRRLSSVWASYQGHMRHANSHRLQQIFHRRHPWLANAARPRRFDYRLEDRRITIKVTSK